MEKQTVEEKPVAKRGWRGAERRSHPRFACDGAAEVVVNNAEFLFRGEIRDISLSGCYVRSRARLRLHREQEVELYFNLDNEQVKCQARAMSIHAGKGAGFEFLPLTERAQRSIRALIRRFEEEAKPAATSADATSASAAADTPLSAQTECPDSTLPAQPAGS